MSDEIDIGAEVGRALHRLRQERGLTVTELSAQAGVSQPMISKIENGQVSPSLSTLGALAGALSVPVMALFAQTAHSADVHHVRAGQGLPSRRVTTDHAHDYLLLGKHEGPGGTFQSARIRIEKSDADRLPTYQHEGHVFICMIEGNAIYACGADLYAMAPGDTLSFDAKLTHGFHELQSDHVEFITVSTRPA